MGQNITIIQYFEWYLDNDGNHWNNIAKDAEKLKEKGISHIWLPPAYKGTSVDDVGYGVYDMYDLGEFYQKGTVRTKYGTKDEYINAINTLHKFGINVLADIVLNQKMGADQTEDVLAAEVDRNDRNHIIAEKKWIKAWTKFTFPGRNGKYSNYEYSYKDFSGTDWDANESRGGIFCFDGKSWNNETDIENGNYDYLMGVDIDTDNLETANEIKKWLKWYFDFTGIDGVRLDAVKHISFDFYENLLDDVRKNIGRDFFAVGEYWNSKIESLLHYLGVVSNKMSLFDVPLHFNFFNAANSNGNFDMRNILQGSLVDARPENAVTFVDNHDTQPGQALQSFIPAWFKPLAYAIILLRNQGIPCVFYGDYYGIKHDNIGPVEGLDKLLNIRKNLAYGEQVDYFDHPHIVGWVRKGDKEHPGSGIAVLMSDEKDGKKWMEIGKDFKGKTFVDALGICQDKILINEDGWGEFETPAGGLSVWVEET